MAKYKLPDINLNNSFFVIFWRIKYSYLENPFYKLLLQIGTTSLFIKLKKKRT